jgi:cysteine desulfurase
MASVSPLRERRDRGSKGMGKGYWGISCRLVSRGNLHQVAHITGNFQAEAPLSPRARAALGDAIDQGWSDPSKLSHFSAKARILNEGAVASMAEILGVRSEEIEILGEPGLGHFYAIEGLLRPDDTLVYSSADRKEIFAIARNHPNNHEINVAPSGLIDTKAIDKDSKKRGVLALQAANGETGVVQDVEALVARSGELRIAADYSSAGTRVPLPSRWDSAFFDARSWQGPQGVGVLAIRESSGWKNPLPHIGNSRTPRSASLPLTIAAAIALEEWQEKERTESTTLRQLTQELRSHIGSRFENCDVAGSLENSLPNISSFSFLYVEGEELLRRLELLGFAVDSGSACTAEDLEPSHVLAAMGLLTHGNIRVTLHHGATAEEVRELATAIEMAVTQLRAL